MARSEHGPGGLSTEPSAHFGFFILNADPQKIEMLHKIAGAMGLGAENYLYFKNEDETKGKVQIYFKNELGIPTLRKGQKVWTYDLGLLLTHPYLKREVWDVLKVLKQERGRV